MKSAMHDRPLDPLEETLRFYYLDARMLRPALPPPPVPVEPWDDRLLRELGRLWAIVVAYRRWIYVSAALAIAMVIAIVPEILLVAGAMAIVVGIQCALLYLFASLAVGILGQLMD